MNPAPTARHRPMKKSMRCSLWPEANRMNTESPMTNGRIVQTTGDERDFAKEQQLEDLQIYEKYNQPRRLQFEERLTEKEEVLQDIQRENVKESNKQY